MCFPRQIFDSVELSRIRETADKKTAINKSCQYDNYGTMAMSYQTQKWMCWNIALLNFYKRKFLDASLKGHFLACMSVPISKSHQCTSLSVFETLQHVYIGLKLFCGNIGTACRTWIGFSVDLKQGLPTLTTVKWLR